MQLSYRIQATEVVADNLGASSVYISVYLQVSGSALVQQSIYRRGFDCQPQDLGFAFFATGPGLGRIMYILTILEFPEYNRDFINYRMYIYVNLFHMTSQRSIWKTTSSFDIQQSYNERLLIYCLYSFSLHRGNNSKKSISSTSIISYRIMFVKELYF